MKIFGFSFFEKVSEKWRVSKYKPSRFEEEEEDGDHAYIGCGDYIIMMIVFLCAKI